MLLIKSYAGSPKLNTRKDDKLNIIIHLITRSPFPILVVLFFAAQVQKRIQTSMPNAGVSQWLGFRRDTLRAELWYCSSYLSRGMEHTEAGSVLNQLS